MAPRETENNAYAKFWGDKQRTLWYVMAFLEWSIWRMLALCTKSSSGMSLEAGYCIKIGQLLQV